MKVKLDLHTHVWEATGFSPPSREVVEQVIRQVRSRGINGLAITDHDQKEYAFAFRELLEEHFPGQMIVIPGWEVSVRPAQSPFDEYHLSELFLPGGRVLRCYCHPGYYTPHIVLEDNIHAIEVANSNHNWHIPTERVERLAREHDLLLLSVSDAHSLDDIGNSYTEIEMGELCRHASSLP